MPGLNAEVAIVVGLVPGLTQEELGVVLGRVQEELASSDVIADRVDSLEIKLATA